MTLEAKEYKGLLYRICIYLHSNNVITFYLYISKF